MKKILSLFSVFFFLFFSIANASYLGSWKIDDYLTFSCNTHDPDTGVATDAASVPTYRIYEDETTSAILSGSTAKIDDGNTTGFYTERVQLTAANGLEKGKSYTIYIAATVDSDAGTMSHNFQIEAEVDSNIVSASNVSANIEQVGGDAITDNNDGRLEVNIEEIDDDENAALAMEYIYDGRYNRAGTAQSGGADTIQLAATASATDDYYNESLLVIVGGTGIGQARMISDYVGGSTNATVCHAWATNPDATSIYMINPFGGVNVELIEGGDASDAINAAVDDAFDTAIPATPTGGSINSKIKRLRR